MGVGVGGAQPKRAEPSATGSRSGALTIPAILTAAGFRVHKYRNVCGCWAVGSGLIAFCLATASGLSVASTAASFPAATAGGTSLLMRFVPPKLARARQSSQQTVQAPRSSSPRTSSPYSRARCLLVQVYTIIEHLDWYARGLAFLLSRRFCRKAGMFWLVAAIVIYTLVALGTGIFLAVRR